MSDTTMQPKEAVDQVPSQTGAEESAAPTRDAMNKWNCEQLDRLIEEANALALYVSRHGNSLPDKNHAPHEDLLKAIADINSSRSPENWQSLMSAYAKLTAVTYETRGVNGRTILDTQTENPVRRRWLASRNRPMVIGVAFFIFALIFEVSMRWSGGVSDSAALTGIRALLYLVVNTLSSFLVPALWGGIGACIFLAKRISDKLFDMAYEESRMRGGIIRIFLGSMLGVVTVVLIFPDFSEQIVLGDLNLAPAMVAFIAGLGVKPVYAGFESLSEELARRFKGSDASRQK